ncbi:hypothetical protein NESM_000748200 [Novymonas esmeraldas]|uniref:Uncharacterized protein n=1 Tax=Novymonas esmeraldas TaxID=1808958 RepID=A0AAW0EUK1_9TRYP
MRRAAAAQTRDGGLSGAVTAAAAAAGGLTPFFTHVPCRSWRLLHTPPGGFEEPLPASFGRQSGKGELSNVNLRSKLQKAARIKKSRRQLRIPSQSSSPPTLARVKGELQQLIKRTREARGEPPSAHEEWGGVSVRVTDPFASPSASRLLPPDVAHSLHNSGDGEDTAAAAAAAAAPLSPSTDTGGVVTAASSLEVVTPADEEAWTSHEDSMERRYTVKPTSTIFGSDLDRLERDMMREYHQRGDRLPPRDRVYAEFGGSQRGRRMQWEPSSSFERLASADFSANARSETVVGDHTNRNVAAYHMYAEAYETQQEEHRRRQQRLRGGGPRGSGVNLCRSAPPPTGVGAGAADTEDLPASENPHFPAAAEGTAGGAAASSSSRVGSGRGMPPVTGAGSAVREIVIDARTDYKARLSVVPDRRGGDGADAHRVVYDAYNQRPTDNTLLEVRGADYWGDPENRRRVEERSAYRQEAIAREVLHEGAVDTSEVEYSINKVRKETLLYFQAHPINEMIQEPFVRVRHFLPPGGGAQVSFNPVTPAPAPADGEPGERDVVEVVHMDTDVPVQEARRMAQELGLDLIRVGAIHSQKTDRRVVALCMIGDHREHMREMIKFKIQKLGVQPPPTRECVEVPFKGGTHPHAIRFKCIGVAKHLLHRHAIRINLTKFGSPREGFPVFQSILDELRRQCMQLKAYHTAGEIQSNYHEIFCYLYPSTGRSPKTTVTHPTPQQVLAARDERMLENEKEIHFDDLQHTVTMKQRLQYMLKLENGTAWAEKDEGMSLRRQRAIKVMLGYLPKGNRELYAARGDVNIPAPFRASHPTSVHKWSYPSESNLEQASRGAAALGKRAAMPISEMHDAGETPENPTQLDRFYYTAQGSALEMGELKEALGLKDNRTRRPPMAGGFATLGVQGSDPSTPSTSFATK